MEGSIHLGLPVEAHYLIRLSKDLLYIFLLLNLDGILICDDYKLLLQVRFTINKKTNI